MAFKTFTASIKLLIDQERNKVLLAEAGNDFIDILRSLLKLPLGNIGLLFRKNKSLLTGCLDNLNNSVENLSLNSFRTHACKRMLLYPRSIHKDKPVQYFTCKKRGCGLLSYYETSRCSCGKLMNSEIYLEEMERDGVKDENEGGFSKVESRFFITDDLRVMKGLPGDLIQFLNKLGIKDVNMNAVKELEIGSKEIFNLLSHSLISKTTLTDVFLRKQGMMLVERPPLIGPSAKETTAKDGKTRVKIMERKSDRKILYAEANEDFVDLLFSLLTIPLESVLQLVGDSYIMAGSIFNLFNDLNTIFSIAKPKTLQDYGWPKRIFSFLTHPLGSVYEFVTKSKNSKKVVLPPFYSCPNEIPDICAQQPPAYCLVTDSSSENRRYYLDSAINKREGPLKLLDPKSPEPNTTNSSGYVEKNSLFVITDDLVVKPLSSVSSISLLKEIGVAVDDVEEQVITIGGIEALGLLRACLCSSSALSDLMKVYV
ncbi:uncharacterized protein LOC108466869 [Gossypium arboreum]|uniref:DUF674 family protein n=1 Tax=Gossypium arboreum TaxID=29729 RepID=A0ABR0QQ75_GOSAR|nr:uncharacterized protein LOC108466869 [Gossypium arboreum]KAK5841455.1 hypothetical protein PVK06_003776 [Gossypium arboreum]